MAAIKTIRFSQVVEKAGQPESYTPWVAPAEDKTFSSLLRQHCVLTVHQESVGSKKDYGEAVERACSPLIRRTDLEICPGVGGIDGARRSETFREPSVELVLRSWPDVEVLNVRRIGAKSVKGWLRNSKAVRPQV